MRIKILPLLICGLYGAPVLAEGLPAFKVHPGLLGLPDVTWQAVPAPTKPTAPTAQTSTPPAPPAPIVPSVPIAAPPLATAPTPPRPLPAGKAPAMPAPGTVPVTITADSLTGQTENETRAEGNVVAVKGDITLTAERLVYRQLEDEIEAEGQVDLRRGQDQITGPHARLRFDEQMGVFNEPHYRFVRAPQPTENRPAMVGSGQAERIEFQGENHYRLFNATYSTCEASPPDWYAQASDLRLDYDNERAEGDSARVVFKGVPIIALPWLDFSLNNKRKSGLLAPTIGSSSRTGFDYTQPIYWDIAPDMDATLSPRLISRRGLQLGAEYRYLGARFRGDVRGEYLDRDQVTGTTRDALFVRHQHNFGGGFSGSLDYNGVSDGRYFSDLSSRVAMTSQSNLLQQGQLTYGGGWWSASLTAQRFQTLQESELTPITSPYQRMPQLLVNASRPDLPAGALFQFTGEYVDFRHDTLDQGQRIVLYPQLAWPLQSTAFLLTPKVGAHHTRYALDRRQSLGDDAPSRTLPIFSIDASVVFERDTDLFGRSLTQTLEPRLYYVRTPYRDQSMIPVFDSAQADFNFAQMFSENVFAGPDRISDANQLTVALTSRAINPTNGAELMRAAIGQRYYFSDQRVTLPGVAPRSGSQADFLAAISGRVDRYTLIDVGWQYNPRVSRTERYNLGARYQPQPNQVANVSYRYTRDVPELGLTGVRDLDVSMQWPLAPKWYGLARYDYSLRDNRVVEALGGLEYDGGCWVVRMVAHRLATAADVSNTSFFIQLELNGFSRIGSNPLDLLKRSIGGYGVINQTTADPVFGTR